MTDRVCAAVALQVIATATASVDAGCDGSILGTVITGDVDDADGVFCEIVVAGNDKSIAVNAIADAAAELEVFTCDGEIEIEVVSRVCYSVQAGKQCKFPRVCVCVCLCACVCLLVHAVTWMNVYRLTARPLLSQFQRFYSTVLYKAKATHVPWERLILIQLLRCDVANCSRVCICACVHRLNCDPTHTDIHRRGHSVLCDHCGVWVSMQATAEAFASAAIEAVTGCGCSLSHDSLVSSLTEVTAKAASQAYGKECTGVHLFIRGNTQLIRSNTNGLRW